MAITKIDGFLPNSQVAMCRDQRSEAWEFAQVETGLFWRRFQEFEDKPATAEAIHAYRIAPGSAIAAIKGGKTHSARLYYVDTNNRLREMREKDDVWISASTELIEVRKDTALAVTHWDGLDHIRIYYQDEKSRLCEYCYDKGVGWHKGHVLHDTALPPVPIAAYSFEPLASHFESKGVRISVPFLHDGRVRMYCYDGSKGIWDTSPRDLGGTPASFSKIAAAESQRDKISQVVLYQAEDGKLRRLGHFDDGWQDAAIEDQPALPRGAPLAAAFMARTNDTYLVKSTAGCRIASLDDDGFVVFHIPAY